MLERNAVYCLWADSQENNRRRQPVYSIILEVPNVVARSVTLLPDQGRRFPSRKKAGREPALHYYVVGGDIESGSGGCLTLYSPLAYRSRYLQHTTVVKTGKSSDGFKPDVS